MNLKPSYYNFIYDDFGKDRIVFYNSRIGSLSIVHDKQYKQFQHFLDSGEEIKDKEFLDNLLKCGYLLPKDIDERFLIKTNMMIGRYRRDLLSLTIAPTMACNFRCVYCFEQGHYGHKMMSESTQTELIEFIKNKLGGIKHLFITWFGGEPLLGMPVIENISKK